MKKIGFLSFGHWTPSPQSQTRSAADALLQSIDLAVAAEALGRGRGLFPRPPLRPPARLALSVAGGRRRQDQPHRDRHRGHRHALRESALYGRGCGRSRPHRWRAAATRHQPRLARAGDRRMALFRLPAGGGRERRRHGPAPRGEFLDLLRGEGFAEPNPRPMFPNPPGLLRLEPHSDGPARSDLVGRRLQRHRGLGGEAGHEPAKLDAQERRDRRAIPRPAGRPDPRLPRRMEGGRSCARAARLGQPKHLRAGG